MPRAYRAVCALLSALMLTAASPPAVRHHRPADIPAFPVNVESLSLTFDGPCAAIATHNPDETRVTLWGLSRTGLEVQPGAYDFLRPYEAAAGCLQPGWNVSAGIQYGHKFAQDAANPYVAASYRVQLGEGLDLQIFGGGFFEGWNRHRKAHPITTNFGNFYPFIAVEFHDHF